MKTKELEELFKKQEEYERKSEMFKKKLNGLYKLQRELDDTLTKALQEVKPLQEQLMVRRKRVEEFMDVMRKIKEGNSEIDELEKKLLQLLIDKLSKP